MPQSKLVRYLPTLLPRGVPFRCRDARAWGLSERELYGLEAQGLLRRLLQGVLVTSDAADSFALRASALELVVPNGGVVTDQTAAWLHGVSILPRRGPKDPPPKVHCFSRNVSRMRRDQVVSGTRNLTERDVQQIGPLWATTPLRTACDLGRLLYRFDALAALDSFARAGVSAEAVERETVRFKGMRGVIQLRALTQYIDVGAESPGESALRLHWIEAGLPPPQTQVWVWAEGRRVYRLDIADPRVKYAAEYDGEQFHGPDSAEHDRGRRTWLAEQGWTVDVFRRKDVYAKHEATFAIQSGHRGAVQRHRGLAMSN